MPSVPLAFLFVALVILVGFVASRLFSTTRVPDVPLLLSIGLLIGPLNRTLFHNQFLETSFDVNLFKTVAPFLSTLALIVILFDSGLKLNFAQFSRSMKPAFAHTLPIFILTVFAIAMVGVFVLGLPTSLSVILGVALSNVGQTVAAAIIRDFTVKPEVRSIYFVEMAIYDVLSIPILVSMLEFIKGAGGVEDIGLFLQSLARIISVSLTLGLGAGLIWIYVLLRLESFPYTYMVTLATLLLVFSINSFIGGSGPVAVLIFGLVLGNRNAILRLMRKRTTIQEEGERVHSFHDEITFFVRSFFFVFLGIAFSTGIEGGWNIASPLWPFSYWNETGILFLIAALLILVLIVAVRYLVVRYFTARADPDRMSLWAVYGRGVGTAVLATYPFTIPEYQDRASAYYALFGPYESLFTNLALATILLTVLGTAITVFWEEHRIARRKPHRARSDVRAAKE